MLFLSALIILKTGIPFRNREVATNQQKGLLTGNETVVELVNKDTDGDGIPDWEESLWGTDPTKKETVAGIPDSVTIEKLKQQQAQNQATDGTNSVNPNAPLTQTDQFSRELLTTVTTLNQNGTMTQDTADQLGNSLADKIQNSAPRKVYTLADLKITDSDINTTIKKYGDTLNSLYPKTLPRETVIDILQKFTVDENNPDVSVLAELDPIIKINNTIVQGMAKMSVPKSLAQLHLDTLNAFEGVLENLNDMQLYNTDPVVALGGISRYQTNANSLDSANQKLIDAIHKKLNN